VITVHTQPTAEADLEQGWNGGLIIALNGTEFRLDGSQARALLDEITDALTEVNEHDDALESNRHDIAGAWAA
jgi:hypothetical protein